MTLRARSDMEIQQGAVCKRNRNSTEVTATMLWDKNNLFRLKKQAPHFEIKIKTALIMVYYDILIIEKKS